MSLHITAMQLIADFLFSSMWFMVLGCTHPRRFNRWLTLLIQTGWIFFYIVGTRILPFMSTVRVLLGLSL